MGLAEYRHKRDFRRTPEPAGKRRSKKGRSFVVQKHDARRLHYDLRLELDGVLKSWAVPKGPSLDPNDKRLAVEVEDHPLEYGNFEGTIPQGEYGGGTVMLWDRGSWEPVGDPRGGYRQGKLKFKLHGKKLHGGWLLVRRHSKSPDENNWLLIKQRDEGAKPREEGDILEDEPRSVSTGRDLEGIAGVRRRKSAQPAVPAKKSRLPTALEVQLATLTEKPPAGDEWLHEIKLDGYRMLCRIDGRRAQFISRNRKDWTERLSSLARAAKKLPLGQAILDGEVVAVRQDGVTDFQLLQNAFREGRERDLIYYVFDILYFNGWDLRGAPLEERKKLLADALDLGGAPGSLRLSEHVIGNGLEFFAQACRAGVEGIISKRRDRPHVPGRGYDWLKVKCIKTGEFVIGGYTPPGGSRKGFGALLLGYYSRSKELVYAGKVGTGFDQQTLRELLTKLEALRQDQSPFTAVEGSQLPERRARWVKPQLVAQIEFSNWTRDGLLRHASFQGLREDKRASAVRREEPLPIAEAVKRSARPKGKSRKEDVAVTNGSKSSRRQRHPAARSVNVDDYNAKAQEFRGVRLTSPDKDLYPDQGITKLDLATYYATIADWMLPHVAGRPLVLLRCPDGRHKDCFFQKHPGAGTPANLRQVPIREKNTTKNYVVVDDAAGLISLAQIGALEIHAWGAKADQLEKPDRLVFDLDPDPDMPWARVVQSAHQVRKFLEDLGLESFVKTTGGKGLHLVVPVQRRHAWDEAKAFCREVTEAIAAADPGRYTSNISKAARHGKIFIDYLRNGRGATSVAPYSTRAKADAPVSMPLKWAELTPQVHSNDFTIRNTLQRLESLKNDPWVGIASLRQSISAAQKALKG